MITSADHEHRRLNRVVSMPLAMLVLSGAVSSVLTFARQEAGRPQQLSTEMRSYLEKFAGDAPLDCGQYFLLKPFVTASADELERAVICARDSGRKRQAFLTLTQLQGIDSLVFEGLVGTSEGEIYKFEYDSAPCGNSSCAGRFSARRCDEPTVTKITGRVATFGCTR